MAPYTQRILLTSALIAYVLLFLLVLLARCESVFAGAYNTREVIWACWSILSFGLILFAGYRFRRYLEKRGLTGSRKLLILIAFFVITFYFMGVFALLAPRISKDDIRYFLKNDYKNFEKVYLIKNDIFKQHADIYTASYFSTVRQNNYWQIRNITGDWLNDDLSEYDSYQRLTHITKDNEIQAIVFSEHRIEYHFNGFSNLVLIREDSNLSPKTKIEDISRHYFIEEQKDDED